MWFLGAGCILTRGVDLVLALKMSGEKGERGNRREGQVRGVQVVVDCHLGRGGTHSATSLKNNSS